MLILDFKNFLPNNSDTPINSNVIEKKVLNTLLMCDNIFLHEKYFVTLLRHGRGLKSIYELCVSTVYDVM